LLSQGVVKCAKKFGEEAVEAALASVSGDKQQLAAESGDVLYHLLVLWAAAGITPEDVYAALKKREDQSGLAEKASRKT
jgi:phosphoribosyl-ATP pyrophosphohydrolase